MTYKSIFVYSTKIETTVALLGNYVPAFISLISIALPEFGSNERVIVTRVPSLRLCGKVQLYARNYSQTRKRRSYLQGLPKRTLYF
jgi:hypothetical protein